MLRAECTDCGETWEGEFDEVDTAVAGHDDFHDVQVERIAADGGAIDNDFESAELPAAEQLAERLQDSAGGRTHADMQGGDLALDLLTRQPLYIHHQKAESIIEYYEAEDFDLASYKAHPYLPVALEDPVFECVYIETNAEAIHRGGDTYDFPAGRLARIPVELAWEG